MTQPTEAACLFETGVLYGRRTLIKPATGVPVFVGFKPGAFSLYHGDAPIVHFDLEGRWQRAYANGLHYLKGLDGSVQTIDRVREGANLVLKRRTLGAAESARFDALVRSEALDLIDTLTAGRYAPAGDPPRGRPLAPDDLLAFLARVADWDADRWSAHRERYRAAYGPLPFIPTDCTSPVVLQATLGHDGPPFGGATAFTHVVRSREEFTGHANAVAGLLGRRVEQCKNVFLGGPDVLRRPAGDVTAYLESARRSFPIEPSPGRRHPDPSGESPHRLDGVHAFLDRFDTPLPTAGDWRRFRDQGLTRVCLGLESGDRAVRTFYGKTWDDDAFRSAVSAVKAAGIGVGVAVLVGAGGAGNEAAHLDATARLLDALELGAGDLVPLIDARELVAPDQPADAPFPPLTDSQFASQRDAFRQRLAPLGRSRVKVVPYSLEKQGPG